MLLPKLIRMLVVAALLGAASPVLAQIAPDPTGRGPYAVANAEYKLPARRDVLVAPFTVTELWARIYRPTNATGPRPVIIMLHGNHATCGRFEEGIIGRVDSDSTYTETGSCPDGFVVVPSHDGYAYLANQLASWGYYVVSINANRGINAGWGEDEDFGLNLRRGRLILRHLMQLDRWNTSGTSEKILGFSLRGKLDFTQIGLFGHSRGGEGIRAALNQYRDTGSIWPSQFRNKPTIRALFELAPVDRQTNRVLNADGVAWNVLLPTCDGDVSDLQGKHVFDRMMTARAETNPTPKSMFTVEGANHNFYNTEWQQSDAQACFSTDPAQPVVFDPAAAGSEAQRTTALYPVTAFFRANLGTDPVDVLGKLLDPAFRMPNKLTKVARFRRTYTDNVARKGSIVLDDFARPVGAGETGLGNQSGGLTYFAQSGVPEHDPSALFGVVAWDSTKLRGKGIVPFYQANAAVPGSGVGVGAFETLEFRIGLACKSYTEQGFYGCEPDPALNPSGTTDFSIALVSPDGFMTQAVTLARYAKPLAPVGVGYGGGIIIDEEPVTTSDPTKAVLPRSDPPTGPTGSGHAILQTVRIPLADFGLPKGAKVRGARLLFNRAAIGAIYLGNVRFTRPLDTVMKDGPGPIPGPFIAAASAGTSALTVSRTLGTKLITGGQVTRILKEKRAIATASQVIGSAKLAAAPLWPAARDVVTLAISVPEPFVIGGSLLTLRIGDQTFRLGQMLPVATQGLRAARFYLTPAAFAALPDNAAMTLENGSQRFDLGPLNKALLR